MGTKLQDFFHRQTALFFVPLSPCKPTLYAVCKSCFPIRVIGSAGTHHHTPVQLQAVPYFLFLQCKDVAGCDAENTPRVAIATSYRAGFAHLRHCSSGTCLCTPLHSACRQPEQARQPGHPVRGQLILDGCQLKGRQPITRRHLGRQEHCQRLLLLRRLCPYHARLLR